ncbi:MAG TPA: HD domain-containing protein [Acidimicrobiales bacterium]
MTGITRVSFAHMDDATEEEMQLIRRRVVEHRELHLVDTLLDLLRSGSGHDFGYQVDRYEHCLQTASRAQRDGAGPDLVVAALFHDVADDIAPDNHSEAAAAILRPVLDEESHWVVRHHGIFQAYHYAHLVGGDRDARERFRGNAHFDVTAHFCAAWDQPAFDPDYDTLPLDAFLPAVREVFGRTPAGWGAA